MAKYTLRRNDGSLYETNSATVANDLVANGQAKLVQDRKRTAVKAAPKVSETKSDEK